MMNQNSKFEGFNVVEEADAIDDCYWKAKLKKEFIDVITAQVNPNNIIYKIGKFKNLPEEKFSDNYIFLECGRIRNLEGGILTSEQGVVMAGDYRLYLKPFTWDAYYQFIKTCTPLGQLSYSFMRVYPSLYHCIKFLKKHYSQFVS